MAKTPSGGAEGFKGKPTPGKVKPTAKATKAAAAKSRAKAEAKKGWRLAVAKAEAKAKAKLIAAAPLFWTPARRARLR
eukprot:822038-Heterocapsa_arctica.AAC.1